MTKLKNENLLETMLSSKPLLASFWHEVKELEKNKIKITERTLQRLLTVILRCFYPKFFTKMVSDVPGVAASTGYDLVINTPKKTIYLEAKVRGKAKIRATQMNFYNELRGYDFIEYAILFFEVRGKVILISYDLGKHSKIIEG